MASKLKGKSLARIAKQNIANYPIRLGSFMQIPDLDLIPDFDFLLSDILKEPTAR